MLVTAFYNMADTFFVGQMNSNAATGAVGVVFSLMAVIQAVGFFFGQGSGNYISREMGKQNYEEASNMAATGFFSALAAGTAICVFGLIFATPLAYLLGSTAGRTHGGKVSSSEIALPVRSTGMALPCGGSAIWTNTEK